MRKAARNERVTYRGIVYTLHAEAGVIRFYAALHLLRELAA